MKLGDITFMHPNVIARVRETSGAHSDGRYIGDPSAVQIGRYFYLDDADRAEVFSRRGEACTATARQKTMQ
jgi:hypothetical protein